VFGTSVPSHHPPTFDLTLTLRDTVNSVGIIPRRLPFTTSNTIVRTFRHAVSLDERRAKFKANLWNRPNEDEKTLSVTDQHVEQIKQKAGPHPSKSRLHALERQYGVERLKATDIEEVRSSLRQIEELCLDGSVTAGLVRWVPLWSVPFSYLSLLMSVSDDTCLPADVGGGSGTYPPHHSVRVLTNIHHQWQTAPNQSWHASRYAG
jgi:hypothetical protein